MERISQVQTVKHSSRVKAARVKVSGETRNIVRLSLSATTHYRLLFGASIYIMTIDELILLLYKVKQDYGNIRVGYDSGVMTFDGSYTIEDRREDLILSLNGEYS